MYGVSGGDLSPRHANKLRMGTHVALAAPVKRWRRVSVGYSISAVSDVLESGH